ncbi:MAG: DivIVA domain-containing protein [Firmicutes bacterium]|nr:DivIVA domain-containing protein [Bacillota bacterium]
MTPDEIRKKKFPRGIGGYDADSVSGYLREVADELDKLKDERDLYEKKFNELADGIEKLMRIAKPGMFRFETKPEPAPENDSAAQDLIELMFGRMHDDDDEPSAPFSPKEYGKIEVADKLIAEHDDEPEIVPEPEPESEPTPEPEPEPIIIIEDEKPSIEEDDEGTDEEISEALTEAVSSEEEPSEKVISEEEAPKEIITEPSTSSESTADSDEVDFDEIDAFLDFMMEDEPAAADTASDNASGAPAAGGAKEGGEAAPEYEKKIYRIKKRK